MARVAMKGTAAAEPAADGAGAQAPATGRDLIRRRELHLQAGSATDTWLGLQRQLHDRVDQLPSRPRAAAWRACSLLRPLALLMLHAVKKVYFFSISRSECETFPGSVPHPHSSLTVVQWEVAP